MDRYPFLAAEIFACELNGIIDNFFSEEEVQKEEMNCINSVENSEILSSTISNPHINEKPIDENELSLALNKEINIKGNESLDVDLNEEKEGKSDKIKFGDFLFEYLNNYFENKPEFINPTSAVYFQKVLYALLNKKGYEVFY